MRSLPLLAFLLFAVVVSTSAQSLPRSPRATQEEMKELMANGGRRRFIAHNGWFLTDVKQIKAFPFQYDRRMGLSPQNGGTSQQWTIERMNDNEVVIRGSSGEYIQHSWGIINNAELVPRAQEWEMLTPVKNANGSWSFKSRWNKWLSGGGSAIFTKNIDFMPENLKCEQWWLEPW